MHNTIESLLFAAGVMLAGPALAQDAGGQEVAKGPTPAWAAPSEPLPVPADATGLLFVRQQDVIVHLDARGQSTYFGQRIALLNPQALQLGNVAIAWNPASGTPMVHALRIQRDGETIDVLETTQFEILRREDMLEMSALTGTLTAVLRVPDLRVGDELEVAYTAPTGDPTLRDQNATIMM
jgi:hypothetical protein